jgi:tight adherence protein B
MNALVLILGLLVFIAVGAIALAVVYPSMARASAQEKRVGRLAGAEHSTPRVNKADDGRARRRSVQQTLKDLDAKQKYKASRSTNPPLELRLRQAGLSMSKTRFLLIGAGLGLAAVLLALVSGQSMLISLGIGLVFGAGVPRFVVGIIRKRRQAAFTEELPNAVEVIVRGVKAGLPLNDCLRMIATEAREPLRSEFRAILESLTMGVPIDEAVGKLTERMPLPEANFFAIVIAIQSKAGGNLSEALGNLAKVLRERKKMRAKVQAMSMEAKASASIIGALPVIVALLVYITSPEYIAILWTDPAGQIVLGGSALTMFAGVMVMRKMIAFDI